MVILQDGTEYSSESTQAQPGQAPSGAQTQATQANQAMPTQVLDNQNAQDILQQSLQMPLICVGHQNDNEENGLVATLEQAMEGFRDRVLLVTLDISAHPLLAQQIGFMRPSAKLIMQGQVLAELSGQEPVDQIRSLFERMVGPAVDVPAVDPNLSEEEQWITRIEQLRSQQAWQEAEACIQEASTQFPNNVTFKALATHTLLDQQRFEEAKLVLGTIDQADACHAQLDAKIKFFELGAELNPLPQSLDEDPAGLNDDDLWAHAIAACYQSDYTQCFESLLLLFKRNSSYREKAPKQALQWLLTLMGPDHADVKTLRRRLFSVLH